MKFLLIFLGLTKGFTFLAKLDRLPIDIQKFEQSWPFNMKTQVFAIIVTNNKKHI